MALYINGEVATPQDIVSILKPYGNAIDPLNAIEMAIDNGSLRWDSEDDLQGIKDIIGEFHLRPPMPQHKLRSMK